jgi:hypothetical protein
MKTKKQKKIRSNFYYFRKKIVFLLFKGELVRDWLVWGTYGKEAKLENFKWVILKNMSDEHIEAILKT